MFKSKARRIYVLIIHIIFGNAYTFVYNISFDLVLLKHFIELSCSILSQKFLDAFFFIRFYDVNNKNARCRHNRIDVLCGFVPFRIHWAHNYNTHLWIILYGLLCYKSSWMLKSREYQRPEFRFRTKELWRKKSLITTHVAVSQNQTKV